MLFRIKNLSDCSNFIPTNFVKCPMMWGIVVPVNSNYFYIPDNRKEVVSTWK